jgi:hypothetical protein
MRMLLLIAAFVAFPAWAQSTAEKPAAKAEPAKAEPAKAAPTKTARKPNPKRSEDARPCLDKPTNTEIIKCAEAYL